MIAAKERDVRYAISVDVLLTWKWKWTVVKEIGAPEIKPYVLVTFALIILDPKSFLQQFAFDK